MKFQKILFILSLVGILFLIFLTQATQQIQIVTIKSIQSSNSKTTIHLEDNPLELILFDTSYLNLKKGDTIEFQGNQDIYKGKEQIIVDRISIPHHNNS